MWSFLLGALGAAAAIVATRAWRSGRLTPEVRSLRGQVRELSTRLARVEGKGAPSGARERAPPPAEADEDAQAGGAPRTLH